MTSKTLVISVFVLLALSAMVLAAPLVAQQDKEVMAAGTYTAKVKAIVCGGCGPLIKSTLEGMKQIEAVSVDQAQKSVQFTVKKNSTVKLADVQKALKKASDKMGMGADYTLTEVKPTK